MQFNDSTNEQGIVQEITFLTGVDTTQYPIEDRTRHVNEGYSRVAYLIIRSDGALKWDDANYSTYPHATADLVADQEDYNLYSASPSDLKDWLLIERVDVEDSNGNAYRLPRFDQSEIPIAYEEFRDVSSTPTAYDLRGTLLTLKPAPDYSRADGLKIYFQRAPSYFSTSDTTKEPGFASLFHHYLPLYAAYKWTLKTGGQDERLKRDLQQMEREIQKFYSGRERKQIKRRFNNYT